MARLAWLLAVPLFGCAPHVPEEAQLARAEALWQHRDPGAYEAYRALPPETAARHRLADADAAYREGLRRLTLGLPDAADALRNAASLGPIDPALYLPLARVYRDRGLSARAADFYRKFLRSAPAAERAVVEAELRALDPEVDFFEEQRATTSDEARVSLWPFAAAAAGLIVLAAAVSIAARRRRTLLALTARSPELQPAIAYLVGCVRHEFLKHRISALRAAMPALERGRGAPRALGFLGERQRRGESLVAAFDAHVATFPRTLGPDFAVGKTDPLFRGARRAVAAIAEAEPHLARSDDPTLARRAAQRVGKALATLADFDTALARLGEHLARTRVDRALLVEVVDTLRDEAAASAVPLEQVIIGEVPPELDVEIYRVDLLLILRNLTRNAIAAAARGRARPRVALDVELSLEPTGLESVRVRVHDSGEEPLPPAMLRERRVGRGLGLVNAALDRYDGALFIEREPGGTVVGVRLFRALADASASDARAPERAA